MSDNNIGHAIIVGIDGSAAAVHAAVWAADEARSREVPLRLLTALKQRHASAEDYHRDVVHAEKALQEAKTAVEATGTPVKIETEMLRGQPGMILLSESDDAEMICVGSVGIDRYSRALLGSTATEVAEHAQCPVAVIRSEPDQPARAINWIVVALDDSPGRDLVVDQAMREAQLRKIPVLAIGSDTADGAGTAAHQLDNHVWPWRQWYPDVHIYPVVAHDGVADFLKNIDDLVPLTVVGSADAGELARIVGPYEHPIFHTAQSSVLVIRG
jgi:nucleotide-binding universal stress UspA family protein